MANTCKARIGKGMVDTVCGAPCGNRRYCRVHRQQNAARQRRYRANTRANTRARYLGIPCSRGGEDAALEMAYELRTELGDGIADGIAEIIGVEGCDG